MNPNQRFDSLLLQRAQNVRVVFLDVDGVLTDGGLYITEHGETLKRFNSQDGLGLKHLLSSGIVPVVITGRDSAALRQRLLQIGVTQAYYGVNDKLKVAREVLLARGLGFEQAAGMGDDWPDLPVLVQCVLAAAPAQAHPEVRSQVHWVSSLVGGHGAVRELCDLILTAHGHYRQLLRQSMTHDSGH